MRVRLAADLLRANDPIAAQNRAAFEAAGVTVVNLLGSPGAGKTTLFERAIPLLSAGLAIGVIEGDLFTDRDARRLGCLGLPVVQINTEGTCHLDACTVAGVLGDLPLARLDLVFIENVGNLVCTAGCDLGEHVRVAVLSVSEGTDKPAKYPAVFRTAGAVVVNKVDLLDRSDFDREELVATLREVNPDAPVLEVSAGTGAGVEEWCRWVAGRVSGRRVDVTDRA